MVMESKSRLGNLLIEKGLITRADLFLALNVQRKDKGLLGEILVELKLIDEDILAEALSHKELIDSGALDDYSHKLLRDLPTKGQKKIPFWQNLRYVYVLCLCLFLLSVSSCWYALSIDTNKIKTQIVIKEKSCEQEVGAPKLPIPINSEPDSELEKADDTVNAEDNAAYIDIVIDDSSNVSDGNQADDFMVEAADSWLSNENEGASVEVLDLWASDAPVLAEPDSSADTAVITRVRYSSTLRDMHVVFESKKALKPRVKRHYLENRVIEYRFADAMLSEANIVDINSLHWLEDSSFEQSADTLIWRFTMKVEGTAKYHELPPTGAKPTYRFVVILRAA